jgi:hypothetical protein
MSVFSSSEALRGVSELVLGPKSVVALVKLGRAVAMAETPELCVDWPHAGGPADLKSLTSLTRILLP